VKRFAENHPNIVTWLVLAIGMVAVLGWSARDVGLTAAQYAWLGVATALLAGLCAWIISWEADDELEDEDDLDQAAADENAASTGGEGPAAGAAEAGPATVAREPAGAPPEAGS